MAATSVLQPTNLDFQLGGTTDCKLTSTSGEFKIETAAGAATLITNVAEADGLDPLDVASVAYVTTAIGSSGIVDSPVLQIPVYNTDPNGTSVAGTTRFYMEGTFATPTGVGIGTSSLACNLTVHNDGSNLVIGTTSPVTVNASSFSSALPAYDLALSGASATITMAGATSQISLGAASEFTANGAGQVSATQYTTTSDARFKNNIETLGPEALQGLKEIRGVSFEWKETKRQDMGVVAQEVAKVFPSLVVENDTRLSVNYNGLIGVLIEVVKHQQERLEALEKKL